MEGDVKMYAGLAIAGAIAAAIVALAVKFGGGKI